MAELDTREKLLFGKWSYDDVEVGNGVFVSE